MLPRAAGSGNGGTGSIISDDGLVITNAHIFTQKGSSRLISNIQVFLKPKKVTGNSKVDLARPFKVKILSYDIPLDLALLKIIDYNARLNQVQFGDSEKIDVGDQAYAIGHPEQGGLWSLTTGVISAQKADYAGVPGKNLFQTEASINRGNSGGPLLNEQGLMIGINSLIARKAADGLTITDVNFSIKSNVALRWLNRLGYRFSSAVIVPTVTEKKTGREEIKTEEPAKPVKEISSPEPKLVKPEPKLVKPEPKPVKKEPTPTKKIKGKILTEKKPFNMDELIAGMQEMEDMMDEMKGMMKQFKKRR